MFPHSTAPTAKQQFLNYHPVCYKNVSLLVKWNYGILDEKDQYRKKNRYSAAEFLSFRKVNF